MGAAPQADEIADLCRDIDDILRSNIRALAARGSRVSTRLPTPRVAGQSCRSGLSMSCGSSRRQPQQRSSRNVNNRLGRVAWL
jgi:hypothetical protein